MNRKRRKDESFKEYKNNLKKENAELKEHLKGQYVHISKFPPVTPPRYAKESVEEYKNRYDKETSRPAVSTRGITYRKPKND